MEFLTHKHPNPEKAKHWLYNLDNLRAKGDLEELPEALRKCQKHAPGRRVLHETVRVEYDVAILSTKDSRPPRASHALDISLSSIEAVLRPHLFSRTEDVFQAKITQAFAALWIGKYTMAANLVGYKLDEELAHVIRETGISQKQTYVCLAKAAYARGVALVKTNTREAVKWYGNMLHVLDNQVASEWQTDGFQMWYERFLASYCILVGHIVRDNRSQYATQSEGDFLVQPDAILTPFQAWSKFINGFVSYKITQQRFMPYDKEATREIVWRLAYNTISVIVQDGFEASVFTHPAEAYRVLRDIQRSYHQVMMSRNSFPPADATTPKMEEWVFQITANWKAVMKAPWCDSSITPVEKLEYSEKLVDLLETTTQLSFQSTRLHRNLLIASTSLGKFDLVGTTLHHYVDMVNKDSTRGEKPSVPGPFIDNDGIALVTLCMGMEALCTYGTYQEVKRAHGLVDTALEWLKKYSTIEDSSQAEKTATQKHVSARAHRAIGLSLATWAKSTPFTEERGMILESAVLHYQRSVSDEDGDPKNPYAHYLLALALVDISMGADQTEKAGTALAEAIRLLHPVLYNNAEDDVLKWRDDFKQIEGTRSAGQALLLKCWHLFAILKVYGGRHVHANEIIEVAFRSYGGGSLLKGENLPASSPACLPWTINEKRRLIELKMMQIDITLDRNDGPQGAQDAMPLCVELTQLYVLLFSEKDEPSLSPNVKVQPAQQVPSAISPPSSSRKSLRKSLLHLPRGDASQAKIVGSPAASSETSPPRHSNSLHLPHIHDYLGRRESKKLQKHPSQRSIQSRGKNRASSSHTPNEPVPPIKAPASTAPERPDEAAKAASSAAPTMPIEAARVISPTAANTPDDTAQAASSAVSNPLHETDQTTPSTFPNVPDQPLKAKTHYFTQPSPTQPTKVPPVVLDTPDEANKPYSIDEIGIAVTHNHVRGPRLSFSSLRPSLTPRLSGTPPPSSNAPSMKELIIGEARADEENARIGLVLPELKESTYEKYPYIHNELDLIYVPEPQYSNDVLARRHDAFVSGMWLFLASVYRQAQEFSDAMHCIEESTTCIHRIWRSLGTSQGLSDRVIRQPGYGGLKSCGELKADNLAQKASILFEQAAWADLSAEYKSKLRAEATVVLNRALELCPNHPTAILVQCSAVLNKLQPFHEASQEVDPEVLPIGPGIGSWPFKTEWKAVSGNIGEASADLDLAVFYLRSLVSSARGFANMSAWQMLGVARDYAGDTTGAMEASMKAVEMGKGAYLAPSIVLENLL